MPYETSVHAQDPGVGRVGIVLDALADASQRAAAYDYVEVAVAYASDQGVRLLNQRLSSKSWAAARKRFLVSIDFGFTQPDALVRLSQLNNAEVRIPNGRAVLADSTLRPPSAFHAKTFAFRADDWPEFRLLSLKSLIVGSANLTVSALSTGAEVVTKQVWTGFAASEEVQHLKAAEPVLDWFEDTWDTADTLSDVLPEYQARFRSLPGHRDLLEERTPATRRYLASLDDHVITGSLPVQLAAAKSLWVDGSSIIHNRQPPRPGNQLNTPRGTRVFFGFSAKNVSKDTPLGTVEIRVGSHPYVGRTMRFANNGMDIINLPIPEQNGVESYEGTFLVFTRDRLSDTDRARFTLTVTNAEGLADLKESASNNLDLFMHSGRGYGLLF
ncbi:hypothetical protein ACFRAU_11545 [Arthrobacter sp. NPDC056691]|uniref:hypothetical protein n=1 Tax=Arthrobacter sp. NPDC056691 TaxID=3345913 RepID=UPI0036715062